MRNTETGREAPSDEGEGFSDGFTGVSLIDRKFARVLER